MGVSSIPSLNKRWPKQRKIHCPSQLQQFEKPPILRVSHSMSSIRSSVTRCASTLHIEFNYHIFTHIRIHEEKYVILFEYAGVNPARFRGWDRTVSTRTLHQPVILPHSVTLDLMEANYTPR